MKCNKDLETDESVKGFKVQDSKVHEFTNSRIHELLVDYDKLGIK